MHAPSFYSKNHADSRLGSSIIHQEKWMMSIAHYFSPLGAGPALPGEDRRIRDHVLPGIIRRNDVRDRRRVFPSAVRNAAAAA